MPGVIPVSPKKGCEITSQPLDPQYAVYLPQTYSSIALLARGVKKGTGFILPNNSTEMSQAAYFRSRSGYSIQADVSTKPSHG